jgi:hypothetical protein
MRLHCGSETTSSTTTAEQDGVVAIHSERPHSDKEWVGKWEPWAGPKPPLSCKQALQWEFNGTPLEYIDSAPSGMWKTRVLRRHPPAASCLVVKPLDFPNPQGATSSRLARQSKQQQDQPPPSSATSCNKARVTSNRRSKVLAHAFTNKIDIRSDPGHLRLADLRDRTQGRFKVSVNTYTYEIESDRIRFTSFNEARNCEGE